MKRKILDTNVIINASGNKSPQTKEACVEICLKLLFQFMAGYSGLKIVIDTGSHGSDILEEYQKQFKYYEGTYGAIFIQWLLNNIMNDQYVIQIPITRIDEDAYEEFPKDTELKKFDPRDRKFIAVAIAHYQYEDQTAPIVQSADMKWKDFMSAFAKHNVEIEFICD